MPRATINWKAPRRPIERRHGHSGATLAANAGQVPKNKSDLERTADLVDVHVVDMLAQVQALLRSVGAIQRDILRLRGVPAPVTRTEREPARTDVQKVLGAWSRNARRLATTFGTRQRMSRLYTSSSIVNRRMRPGAGRVVSRRPEPETAMR